MLVTVHGVIKAKALCKVPIRLHMTPPSTTDVRAYIAVGDGELSGAQPLTSDRERNLNHPLVTPPGWEDPMSISDGPWG